MINGTFDDKAFQRSLRRAQKKFGVDSVRKPLRVLAQSVLNDAINAPIPFESGALARSGQVEDTPTGVAAGFNIVYAGVQDLGPIDQNRPPGPPKPYGTPLGPNRYWTGTVERRAPTLVDDLGRLLQEMAKEIEAESKRSDGRRRDSRGRFI